MVSVAILGTVAAVFIAATIYLGWYGYKSTKDNAQFLLGKNKAKSFEGKDLSELIAVFGEPLSSEYGPSCLGDGKDGELKYDGFIVYTTQKGSAETITLVNAAD